MMCSGHGFPYICRWWDPAIVVCVLLSNGNGGALLRGSPRNQPHLPLHLYVLLFLAFWNVRDATVSVIGLHHTPHHTLCSNMGK